MTCRIHLPERPEPPTSATAGLRPERVVYDRRREYDARLRAHCPVLWQRVMAYRKAANGLRWAWLALRDLRGAL